MQNVDTRKFLKTLNEYGYKEDRSNGSSHTTFERVVVLKHTVSIPTNAKTINGPMADRLLKGIVGFESYVAQGVQMIK